MNVKIITTVILFLILSFNIVEAKKNNENIANIIEISNLTDRCYQNISNNDYLEAKKTIEQISSITMLTSFKEFTAIEGLTAFNNLIIDIKRKLAKINPVQEELIFSCTQLKLATDALIHPAQPLWQRYYNIFTKNIEKLELDIKNNDFANFDKDFKTLTNNYELIRPSIIIQKESYLIQQFDSMFKILNKQRERGDKKGLLDLLQQLKYLTAQLFFGNNETTWKQIFGIHSIITTIASIVSLILIILIYVAIKKIHGEKFKL